jgi:hypothetical protein
MIKITEKPVEKKIYDCDNLPVGKFGKVVNFVGNNIDFVAIVLKTEDGHCIIISSDINDSFTPGTILRNTLYGIVLSDINGNELEKRQDNFVPFNINIDISTLKQAVDLWARLNMSSYSVRSGNKNSLKEDIINSCIEYDFNDDFYKELSKQILKNNGDVFFDEHRVNLNTYGE